jgi:hypothetical protein
MKMKSAHDFPKIHCRQFAIKHYKMPPNPNKFNLTLNKQNIIDPSFSQYNTVQYYTFLNWRSEVRILSGTLQETFIHKGFFFIVLRIFIRRNVLLGSVWGRTDFLRKKLSICCRII